VETIGSDQPLSASVSADGSGLVTIELTSVAGGESGPQPAVVRVQLDAPVNTVIEVPVSWLVSDLTISTAAQ
jgi:hypothetical protein